jgi:hypothetical protein
MSDDSPLPQPSAPATTPTLASTTPATTTLTTPIASTALAPSATPPVPPPRFQELDETDVHPLIEDPRMFGLHRATAARVRRFRHVPVVVWFPVQCDLAARPLFSTWTQESFYGA